MLIRVQVVNLGDRGRKVFTNDGVMVCEASARSSAAQAAKDGPGRAGHMVVVRDNHS